MQNNTKLMEKLNELDYFLGKCNLLKLTLLHMKAYTYFYREKTKYDQRTNYK